MDIERYLSSLTEQAAERRRFARGDGADPADREGRRSRLRESFSQLLGEFPAEEQPSEPRLLERKECDGYIRERVEFATVEGLRMPTYVLTPRRPDSVPAAAVIALHGHGYGSREIVGLEPDGSERAGHPGLHMDFAISLAREGFVVFAPELIGFGDRRLEEDKREKPGQNSCFRLAAHLLLTGRTLAGLRVRETMRAVDYARSLPSVDPNRIAVMGISGGGLVAGFAAALDERIRCAVVSGYASLFAESILARNHCLDNYIPGILLEAEMPELLGLIAPRALFLESGDADRVFPREAAEKAYEELRGIYAEAGTPDALGADFFAGGHEIHGEPAFAWLRERLEAPPTTGRGESR